MKNGKEDGEAKVIGEEEAEEVGSGQVTPFVSPPSFPPFLSRPQEVQKPCSQTGTSAGGGFSNLSALFSTACWEYNKQ